MTSLLATLPGLLICYAMFRADKYDREPFVALAAFFLMGAAVTVPVIQVELWVWKELGLMYQSGFWSHFLLAFGVVGFWEELAKMLILLLVYRRSFFDEPLDGIVYAVMIGMGFATVENVAYYERFGPETLWVRVFTAIPAHLIFAVVQGYYLGAARFKAPKTERSAEWLIFLGFFIAFILHGAYDLLVFHQQHQWLFVLATSSVYLCLFYCRDLIRLHLEDSPFR